LSLRSSPRPQLRAKPHTKKWGGKKAEKPYFRAKPHTKKWGGKKGGKRTRELELKEENREQEGDVQDTVGHQSTIQPASPSVFDDVVATPKGGAGKDRSNKDV